MAEDDKKQIFEIVLFKKSRKVERILIKFVVSLSSRHFARTLLASDSMVPAKETFVLISISTNALFSFYFNI